MLAALASLYMGKIWTTQEEADNLAKRFEGLNQAEFARVHNLPGGPSMLNQHIKGRRPMNMDAALVYMKAFGVRLDEISPRLWKEMSGALRQLQELNQTQEAQPEAETDAATVEENPALTLAVEFQRSPAQTVDGRTRDELFDWLMAQIDAWPNADPRKLGRGASPTAAPATRRRKRPERGHAQRAEGSAS